MSSELQDFLSFLDEQQVRHATHFPSLGVEAILSYMGTTSRAGSHAVCSVHRLRGIERGPEPRDLRVLLDGPLPKAPERGECVTVHVTRVSRFQGYQVKTRTLTGGSEEADLFETGPRGVVVKGSQIFTVHHSPYTLQFFENVPFEEVADLVEGLPYALVAIGETANLSPRFVFHREVKDGKLALFHGDGLALKTYMNVRVNRSETRLVLDLDDYSGWALRGTVEEFQPHQHPEAHERICQGFTAGSWGKPSRVFRFVADAFERIRPVG